VVATEETAMNGSWCVGPGIGLFQALHAQLGAVPILAEDLGVITTDVVKLRWAGCLKVWCNKQHEMVVKARVVARGLCG
jgi:hypothetical protein